MTELTINQKYGVENKPIYQNNILGLSPEDIISKNFLSKMSVFILRHGFLLACALFMAFPFLWMFFGSLKTNDEIFQSPLNLFPEVFKWGNFIDTFQKAPFGIYLTNSFIVASGITIISLFNSALFAYLITQMKCKRGNLLFGIVMVCYMLPAAVTYIPSYMILAKADLLNTHAGLIVSNAVSLFGVFYLRQTFLKIHPSLIEAARLDGANEFTILFRIVLPQCKSAVFTLVLLTFISHYNNYLWPSLVISSPDMSLISTGIRQFFIAEGQYGLNWSQIMAASTITVMPLLLIFIICQKYIIAGISDGGVKE